MASDDGAMPIPSSAASPPFAPSSDDDGESDTLDYTHGEDDIECQPTGARLFRLEVRADDHDPRETSWVLERLPTPDDGNRPAEPILFVNGYLVNLSGDGSAGFDRALCLPVGNRYRVKVSGAQRCSLVMDGVVLAGGGRSSHWETVFDVKSNDAEAA